MKTVKTFSSLYEAGFASSLLEASGIPALLADELTHQLVPGMAVAGIRLQVEDQDFERAVLILKEGPDAQVTPASLPPSEAPDGRGGIPLVVFGAFAVALVALALISIAYQEARRTARARSAVSTYTDDYNHDGKPDHFYTYRDGRISKSEVDRNFDGRIDQWEFYDHEGRPEHAESDENFDGRPDVWYFYENGSLVRSERDTDFNGQPDWFSFFRNGILVRSDCRPNGSKIVIRRLIYVNGVLREEWVDENEDGKFDYKILHDPFGRRSERIPIAPAN